MAAYVLWSMAAHAAAAETVRIGVLAYRGHDAAVREWAPHAAYLGELLAPVRFEIVPMSYRDLTEAAHARSVAFVITNTGHYTEMEAMGDVSRIATRVLASPSGPLDRFGGVVVTLAGRDDINSYADIQGKRLLVPDRSSLGGWQVHLREAHDQGVHLDTAPASITETRNHEDVVRGLLEGKGDVGFIRSDLLEAMAARGQIALTAFKVVNERSERGYPYRLSTRLYPEWPFATVQGTSEDLARNVLIALLRMDAQSEAARTAHIQGWVVPLSYRPVEDLFRIMRLGPYAQLDFALRDVLMRYWAGIFLGALGVIALLSLAIMRIIISKRALVAEMARRAEAERRLLTLSTAVAQSPVSVIVADADRRIVYVNDTYCRISGRSRDQVEGLDVSVLRSGLTPDSVYREMWDALEAGRAWSGDLCSQRGDGGVLWEQAVVSPVVDAAGRTVSYLSIKQDITLQRTYENALHFAANHDALTRLPNRALVHDRLDRLCVEGASVLVMHVGVDNLTRVNDSLGRDAGDAVIGALAERFLGEVLATDTVARISGDEFLVLRPDPRDDAEVDRLANALLAAAARPIPVAGVEVQITVRVGVALGPRDGTLAIELEKAAYTAATRAREAGGNTIRHFQRSMDADARWRMEAEYGLRLALAAGGLEIHLQPYVNAQSGIFAGAEALVRWRRPGEGFVAPARFIPVAERSGLIREIDRFVIENAAQAAADLRGALGQVFPIAVNVSPIALHDTEIVDFTAKALARYGLPPAALEVEVTEGVFLADEEGAAVALRAFHELGVPVAIDDFGTGYSSLGYLRRYPVSKVKIDRSFVSGLDADPKLQGLASAIASMAKHLGLTVTAEGVETQPEWELLRDAGCDYIQGFLFARPMTLSELHRLVSAPRMTV